MNRESVLKSIEKIETIVEIGSPDDLRFDIGKNLTDIWRELDGNYQLEQQLGNFDDLIASLDQNRYRKQIRQEMRETCLNLRRIISAEGA